MNDRFCHLIPSYMSRNSHFTNMSADAVNPERMNQVFQQLGINVSWQEVMTRYEDIHNTTAMIQGLNEMGIHKFAELFQFKDCYMEKCKKELQEFIEKFPVFQANSLEEIHGKMCQAICQHNQTSDDPIVYVNCIDEYKAKPKRVRKAKLTQ